MVLSPQLQQSLALLQAPVLELKAMVEQELQMNPILEEVAITEMTTEERESRSEETAAQLDPAEPPADTRYDPATEKPDFEPVDKFDAERGFKFSTYACRAILKSFSRLGIKATKYKEHFPTDFDPKFEKSDHIESRRESHEDECVDELRDIIKENRAALTPIEQSVITHRFSLGKVAIDESSDMLTLEQVGKLVGLTKERVRQIQNKAMAKIRQTLESGFLR